MGTHFVPHVTEASKDLANRLFSKNKETSVMDDLKEQESNFLDEWAKEQESYEQETLQFDEDYENVSKESEPEEELDPNRIFPITERQRQHMQILESVNVMCRSKVSKDGGEFTDNSRLGAIADLLADSPYQCIYQGGLTHIYAQKPLSEITEDLCLVSTHVDTVNAIKECSSTYDEHTGSLRGTYDNTGTNAACVIAMKEYPLKENVIFAFDGDEETGGCKGAEEVLSYIKENEKKVFPIALDVTYESFNKKNLYTIENCTLDENSGLAMVDKIHDLDSNLELSTFTYVPLESSKTPKNLEKSEISSEFSWYDEGAFYGMRGLNSFSCCLPCGEGEMHSTRGVKVKLPVFEGYTQSLVGLIYEITRQNDFDMNMLKNQRAESLASLEEWKSYQPRQTYNYNYSSYYGNSILDDSIQFTYPSTYHDYEDASSDYDELEDDDLELEDKFYLYVQRQASNYEPDELYLFLDEFSLPHEYWGLFFDDPCQEELTDEDIDVIQDVIINIFNETQEQFNLFGNGSYNKDPYDDDLYEDYEK